MPASAYLETGRRVLIMHWPTDPLSRWIWNEKKGRASPSESRSSSSTPADNQASSKGNVGDNNNNNNTTVAALNSTTNSAVTLPLDRRDEANEDVKVLSTSTRIPSGGFNNDDDGLPSDAVPQYLRNAVFYLTALSLLSLLFAVGVQHTTAVWAWVVITVIMYLVTMSLLKLSKGRNIIPVRVAFGLIAAGLQIIAMVSVPHCASYELLGGREFLLVSMAFAFQVNLSTDKRGWRTPLILMAVLTTLLFMLAAARCTFGAFDAFVAPPIKYLVPPSVAVLCQLVIPAAVMVAIQIRLHAFEASKDVNAQSSESFGLAVLKAATDHDIPLLCRLGNRYDDMCHSAIPPASDDALVEVIRIVGRMSLPTLVTPEEEGHGRSPPRSRRGSNTPSSKSGEVAMLGDVQRPTSKESFGAVETFNTNLSGMLTRRQSQRDIARKRRSSRVERVSISNSFTMSRNSPTPDGRNSGRTSPIPHTPNMTRCPAFITYFSLPRMRAYLNGPLASPDLAQMFTVEFAEALMTLLPKWHGKLAFSSFDTLVAVFASPVAAVATATELHAICKNNTQHHKDPALNISEGHRPLTFTALADTFIGSPAAGCAMGYSPVERVANTIIELHRNAVQPVPSNLVAASLQEYLDEDFEMLPSTISTSIFVVRNARRVTEEGFPLIDSIDEILLGQEDLPELPVVETKPALPPKGSFHHLPPGGGLPLSTRPVSATRGQIHKKQHINNPSSVSHPSNGSTGGASDDDSHSQSASLAQHPGDQNPEIAALILNKNSAAKTDSKGKKQLPPQVLEVWNSIDMDQNGYLEMHELEVLIKKIGLSMTKEEIRRFFRQVDVDNSGTITFDEFESAFYSSTLGGATVMSSIRRAGVAMAHSNEKEFISMVDKVWRKYDANGSGRLEEPEIVQILKDLGMSHTPEEVHWLMIKIDKDNNGYIEFDEFITLFSSDGASEFNTVKERIQAVTRVMAHKNDSTVFSTTDQLIRDKKVHIQALVDKYCTPLLFLYIAYVSGSVSFGAAVGDPTQVPEAQMYVDVVLDFFYAMWVLAKIFYLPKEYRGTVIFKDIARHQIRTLEFYIDIISIIPLDFVYFGLGSSAGGGIISYYRLNKMLTFYHLDWCYKLFAEGFNPAVSRAVNALLYFFTFAHIFACALVITTRNVGQAAMSDMSGTGRLLDDKSIRYLKSFYWSILTVAGQLTGLAMPDLDGQVVLLLAGVLCGLPMYTVVLGTIGNAVTVETSYTRFLDKIDGLRSYFEYTQLPKDFENDIVGYYQHLYSTTNTLDITENPLDDLPIELSIQLIIAMGSDMLKAVPIFKSASTNLEFVHELTSKLVPRVIEPRAFVMRKGEVGTDMYFVTFGNFHVFIEGVGNVFTFSRGNFFGEIALLHSSKRTATIVCGERFGNVLVLDKEPFQEVARFFPDCLSQVYKAAEDRIKQIREQEKKEKEAAEKKRVEADGLALSGRRRGGGDGDDGDDSGAANNNNTNGGTQTAHDDSMTDPRPGTAAGEGDMPSPAQGNGDTGDTMQHLSPFSNSRIGNDTLTGTLFNDYQGDQEEGGVVVFPNRDGGDDTTAIRRVSESFPVSPMERPDSPGLATSERLRNLGNAIATRVDYDHQLHPTSTQLFGTQDDHAGSSSTAVLASSDAGRPRSPSLLTAPKEERAASNASSFDYSDEQQS